MNHEGHEAFLVGARPTGRTERAIRAARRAKPLALRELLEHYYRSSKESARDLEIARRDLEEREREFIEHVIRLAEEFESAFSLVMSQKGGKRRQKYFAPFQATFETLEVDVLARLGIFRVPLEGRTYTNVEFEGVPIERPFEVVAVEKSQGNGEGESGARQVRTVLQSLWVRKAGGALEVLRRGKVIC